MESGIIFDLKRFAVHDGPGIRTTVFLKGCPLGCSWCHNPEGRNPQPERQASKLSPGEFETVGKEMTVADLLAELDRDRMFYEQSGGGVTFSGGEPLLQHEFLLAMINECHDRGLNCAVDTCGHADPAVFQEVAAQADLFLFDIKLIDPTEHLKHTGVDNELILSNLRYLSKQGVPLVVRFPAVPGITDTTANVAGILETVKQLNGVKAVQVLPFHRMAGGKCQRLGIDDPAAGIPDADDKRIEEISAMFLSAGLRVDQGGH